MKKWLTLLLVVIMGFGIIAAGCTNSDNSGNSSNTSEPRSNSDSGSANKEDAKKVDGFKLGEKPLKFTFFKNANNADMPWGNDPVSKWISENLKVTIDWVPSNGNAKQKLNTLLVGGDLPDSMRISNAEIEQFAAAGELVPLDDFITKDTNLYRWAGKGVLDMLRSKDGKLYTIPNWFIGGESGNGNGGWMVNAKIYKELGSPKLETITDLEKYLRLVKEKYPDVIPLEMTIDSGQNSFSTLYTAFGEGRTNYFMGNLFYPDGSTLKPITDDPAFKEMALFASKLFRDKLITQDAFTQKNDQIIEKLKQQRVAVLVSRNVLALTRTPNAELKKNNPGAGYDILWPIHKEGLDKNKIYPNSFNRLGSGGAVITKQAKDPQAIFSYIDWSLSEEGQRILWFGPPGLYWDKFDGQGSPLPTDAYLNSDPAQQRTNGLGEHILIGNTTFVDSSKAKRELQLPENKRDAGTMAQVNVTWKTTLNVTEFANIEPAPNSDEGIIAQNVQDIFDQAFAKMIFAASDAEVQSILEKAKKDMAAAGINKLMQFKQKVWEANKSALGNK